MTDRQSVKWRKFRNVQIWNELLGHTYIIEVRLGKLYKSGAISLAAFTTRFPHRTDAYCNVYYLWYVTVCFAVLSLIQAASVAQVATAAQMQRTPLFTAARTRLAQSPWIWPCTQSFYSIRFQKTSLPSGREFCSTFFPSLALLSCSS